MTRVIEGNEHAEPVSCEVCGRTLLIGERAQTYLSGEEAHSVCDLCVPRAVHNGWVREGTTSAPPPDRTAPERSRSLLARLHAQRALGTPDTGSGDQVAQRAASAPGARRTRGSSPEPRHVHAVPLSDEQKIALAVELFNHSQHRRTVSGVSRSLGLPEVSVRPTSPGASLLRLLVAWELCWYRYEVDLADDHPTVRLCDQGYELDELTEVERIPNARAQESGRLAQMQPPITPPETPGQLAGSADAVTMADLRRESRDTPRPTPDRPSASSDLDEHSIGDGAALQ